MANLISVETLARWTQNEVSDVSADPFAIDLIEKMSEYICFLGGHPEWTYEPGSNKAPIDVLIVAIGVIKRCYENPGRIIQDQVGPLNERVIEAQALFTQLTEDELATIQQYNAAAVDTSNGGFIFTASIDASPVRAAKNVMYLTDDQQVNLGSELDWEVPMFDLTDPVMIRGE